MKIANLILTSQNGGAEEVFIDYIMACKKLGHEVLAIIKNDAPYQIQLNDLNIPTKKTKNKFGFNDIFTVNNIKNYLQEFDADILICHMGKSHILGKRAIKKIKHKKIFSIAINHSDNVKRSIGSDIILSINKEIFYKTINLGQDQEKSFVMPNKIDLDDIAQFKKVYLNKRKEITIGLIGRLDRSKGFDYVIRSLKELINKTDKKIKLKIAGDGYFKDELFKLVNENEFFKERVEFLGWIQDKKAFFETIDIFILPSLNEPFGLVLLQAMKYAKPIITSNCDGPKEILRDYEHALFIDKNDLQNYESNIANKILELIDDASLANKLVENSLKRLQEKYSPQAFENRLQEIIG